jgi:catechol 2,3-dioxygenase-like lactoylglutathione lyase family enzyme
MPALTHPTITKVLETALYVQNHARSVAFYERVLGFSKTFEDERLVALNIADTEQILLLFLVGSSDQPNPVPGGVIPAHDAKGRMHLAFAIPESEREAWEAKLRQEGVTVESTVTAQYGGTSLYFRDPDGHLIELATPGVWDVY